MIRNYKFILLAGFTATIAIAVVHTLCILAQTNSELSQNKWMTEKWDGESSSYNLLQKHIEAEIKSSKDPRDVVAEYAEPYSVVLDPHDMYAWAVAARLASMHATSEIDYYKIIAGVKEGFLRTPFPHCYPYARIEYLYDINMNWADVPLTALGDRLLSIDSEDPDVLEEASFSYALNVVKAASLADQAIKIDPTNWRGYKTLGYIYINSYWNHDGPKIYGYKGVENLKKYLSMSPSNQDSIQIANHYITEVSAKLASSK